MQIDGRNATSGAIVVGATQQGKLSLPWGAYELIFNPDKAPQNVSMSSSPPQIVFDGTDSALGIAATFNLDLANGAKAVLNLAVYAIGEGPGTTRLVHFTAA